jgi:hypothetical protein
VICPRSIHRIVPALNTTIYYGIGQVWNLPLHRFMKFSNEDVVIYAFTIKEVDRLGRPSVDKRDACSTK